MEKAEPWTFLDLPHDCLMLVAAHAPYDISAFAATCSTVWHALAVENSSGTWNLCRPLLDALPPILRARAMVAGLLPRDPALPVFRLLSQLRPTVRYQTFNETRGRRIACVRVRAPEEMSLAELLALGRFKYEDAADEVSRPPVVGSFMHDAFETADDFPPVLDARDYCASAADATVAGQS